MLKDNKDLTREKFLYVNQEIKIININVEKENIKYMSAVWIKFCTFFKTIILKL